jgi:hypothetical protein
MNRSARAALVWQQRIERQRQSGLSIAAFCRQAGCSAPSFYVWRKRLNRNARARERARPSAAGRRRAQGPEPRTPALFVPLRVATADQQPAVAGGSCRAGQGVGIELPGGAVVRLPGDASVGLVTAAIRAASAAAEPSSC